MLLRSVVFTCFVCYSQVDDVNHLHAEYKAALSRIKDEHRLKNVLLFLLPSCKFHMPTTSDGEPTNDNRPK